MSKERKSSFILIKFLLIIFDLFIIIDSLVHVVNVVKQNNNEKEINNFIYLSIMCMRIVLALLSIFIACKELKISYKITMLSTLLYAIFMLIILFVSPQYINYSNNIISLIVQIIGTYLAISMAYKILMINLNEEEIEIKETSVKTCAKTSKSGKDSNEDFEKNKINFKKVLNGFDKNVIAFSTFLTVVIAILFGYVLRKNEENQIWKERSLIYIGFVGEIFFRMLKGLILPLIFSSLVHAMTNIDTKLSGKMGFRIFCYYLATTLSAIVLGIILVMAIKPGKISTFEKDTNKTSEADSTKEDALLDLIRYAHIFRFLPLLYQICYIF
jgi:hypothetical protein